MRNRSRKFARHAATVASIAAIAGVAGGDLAADGTGSIGAIYASASPGVVEILVTAVSSRGPRGGGAETSGEGSGFVLDTAGHIVTNEHVVEDATSITVKFADGTTAKATVVGADASTD